MKFMKNSFYYLLTALTFSFSMSVKAQTITTFAGNGTSGYSGNGGLANLAQFNKPRTMALDPVNGYIYIAENVNNVVRRVDAYGVITTVAGDGSAGGSGDGGAATLASFSGISGLAVDATGNLYISDGGNHRVRVVNTSGIVRAFAGTGSIGSGGDGGAATNATLGSPLGIALDNSGNLYITDVTSNTIRKVSTSGVISLFAGNGSSGYTGDGGAATSAQFNSPYAIDFDAAGNAYVADHGNNAIRKINTSNIISTVAGVGAYGFGGDGAAATLATLAHPDEVTVDASGNIYIAEEDNHIIRKINASGIISTYAGTPTVSGNTGDGGAATSATLNQPNGVTIDASGNIFISDYSNYTCRIVGNYNFKPFFANGATQSMSACQNLTASINSILSVYDLNSGQTLTWSVVSGPSHGALGGFGTTGTSNSAMVTPTGLTYSPTGGYSGADAFTIQISDGINTFNTVVNVTVNTIAAIGGVTNSCITSTPTLTDATPGGTWSSSNTGVATIGSSTGTITGVSAGTTTITYTAGIAGCYAVTVFTINPVPGAITGSRVACLGVNTLLSDATVGATWSSSNNLVATVGSSTGIVTGVILGTATISYSFGGTCFAVATVTVNPVPLAITGTTSFCAGTTSTLADATVGGTWSSSATSIATVASTTGVVTGVLGGTATISYILPTGCYQTTVVNILDVPAIVGQNPICTSIPTTYTDATLGGTWTSSDAGTATVGSSTGIVTGVLGGNVTISYRLPTGCLALKSVTVSPSPLPITGNTTVCTGLTTALSDASSGSTWTSSNTAVATIGSVTGIVTGVSAGTTIISYMYGCRTSTVVTVNTSPAAITGPTGVCTGASITLSDATLGGTWTSSAIQVTVGSATGIVNGVSAGAVNITYTVPNACRSIYAITVSNSPLAITGTLTGCTGYTATLADASGGGTWVSTNTSVATIGSVTAVMTSIAPGTSAITYTVANGCIATTVLTVNPVPTASVSLATGTICTGGNLTASASVSGGYTISSYTWAPSTGLSATTGASITATTTRSAIVYTLTVTANDGCTKTAFSSAIGSPTVSVSPVSAYSCTSTATTITATGSAGTTYAWLPTSFLNVTSGTTVISTPTISAQYVYTVTSTLTGNGCTATATATLNSGLQPMPWSEGFEGLASCTIPCWESFGPRLQAGYGQEGSGTAAQVLASAGSGSAIGYAGGPVTVPVHAGTGMAGFGFFAGNDYYFTPGFTLTAGNTYMFSFYYATDGLGNSPPSGGDYNGYMVYNTSKSLTGATRFQSFSTPVIPGNIAALTKANLVNINNTTYQRWTGYFTPNSNSTYFFGINAQNNNLYSTVYWGFDDVAFAQTSSCIAPSAATSVVATPSNATRTMITVTAPTADSFFTVAMLSGSGAPSASPVNGTTYPSGATFGGGKIITKGVQGIATVAYFTGLTPGSSYNLYTYVYTHDSCNIVAYSPVSASVPAITVCTGAVPSAPVISSYYPGAVGTAAIALSGLPTTPGGSVVVYAWTDSTTNTPATPASYAVPSLASTYTVSGTGIVSGTNLYFTVGETIAGCEAMSLASTISNVPYPLPYVQNFETGSSANLVNPSDCQGNPGFYTNQAAAKFGAEDISATYVTPHGGSWDYLFFGGANSGIGYPGTGAPYIPIAVYANQWFMTPGLYVSNPGNYTLGFWYYNATAAFTSIGVQWSTDGTLPSNSSSSMNSAVALPTITPVLNTWTLYTTTITIASAPQIFYVGLNVIANSSSVALAIDDIEVCQAPTVVASNGSSAATVCSNGTLTLLATPTPAANLISGSYAYTWSGPGTLTSTGANASVTGLGAVGTNPIYSVTVVNAADLQNLCASPRGTTTATITPVPASMTGTLNACIGNTSTLSDASLGGTWTSNNGAVATIDPSTGVTTGVASGTTTITYTATTSCYTTSNFTVNATPAAIGGANSVCVGSTTTLTDVTSGGTWSSSNANATVGSTTGIVTGVTAGSATITYRVTATGCIATSLIAINPLPSGITGGPNVCIAASKTLSSASLGGTWASSNANSTIGSTTGVITGVTAGSSIITYTLSTGCKTTTVMTISPLPAAITGTTSVCQGLTTTLSDATAGGTWSSSNANATVGSTTGVVTGVTAGTSTISYILPTGCVSTANVTINPLPATITGTTTVCIAGTSTLNNASGGGTWSSSSASATIGSATGIVTGVTAGSATITYTLATGCKITTALTINPNPAAITGTLSACAGGSTTLADATVGGTWSSSNANATVGSSTGVVNGVTTGTATITYSTALGCYATATYTVNGNVAAITGTTSVCAGLTTTLSDITPSGTWSSGSTNATIGSTTGIVTGVTAGTAMISYSLVSGCRATTVITINPLPAAIGGSTTVCIGLSSTLTNSSSGGTWASSNGNVTIGSSTGVVTGVSLGSSTITYTLPTGCLITTVVGINPVPASITGTTTACVGFTTTLSDGTAGGTWSSSILATATVGSTTGIVTGIAGGTSTISYILPTGCSASTVVTINPLPLAITGTTSVCVGLSTTLSDGSAGGTWSINNANATIGSATGTVTGVTSGTSIVSYMLPTGCLVTKTITVNPLPAAISGNAGVCIGSTTTLSDAGGGTWTSDNASVSIVLTTGVASGVSLGTANITYALSTGCIATTIVTVNPLPVAITGTTTVCSGLTTTLSDATSGGVWSSSNGSIATVGSTTGIVTGAAAGSANIIYTLPTGCSVLTSVTVNSAPLSITGTATVCTGNTTTLSDATGGGSWISGNASVATVGSLTGIVSGVSAGTVIITYQVGSSCRSTAIVTVNQSPAAISGSSPLCSGVSATFTDATSSGIWSSSNISAATVGSATGIVNGIAAGSTNISYTLPTGCYAILALTVNNSPLAITGTTTVCTGNTVALSDATGGGNWSSSDNATATVGSVTGIVSGIAAGTATITYQVGSGCNATTVITVNQSPAAIGGSSTVCTGNTITLTDATSGGTWSSSVVAKATVGSTSGIVTGVAAGATNIVYTLPSGCISTLALTVNSSPLAIGGTPTVCSGFTTTLTDATGGGNWSSSNTGVATIGSVTGIVSGILAGTSAITYTISNGCSVNTIVTVNQTPVAITGASSVCNGSVTTLTDGTGGGTWSSSNTLRATINSTSGDVTGIGAGALNISYTLSTGCYAQISFTVNTTPVAIGGTMVVCQGLTTNLTDATSGGTWSSSDIATATIGSTSGIVTGIVAGTATITYQMPNGCNATTIVTVNPTPASIVGSSTVCTGTTTTMTDATGGGIWSSSVTSRATIGSLTGIVTGLTSGATNIIYTLPTGCISSLALTVNSSPAAIGGTTSVCVGFTTTFTDATSGGIWSSSATNASVGSTTGVVTGLNPGTEIISYTVGTGCYNTTVVAINPMPVAIVGASSVCIGSTTTLTNATSGGTWSSSSVRATVGSTTGIVTGITAGSATISYTLPTGCNVTSVMTINSLPATITGTTTVCEGANTTLSDATSGGTWSSSSANATVGSATGIVSGITAGSATISYTLPTGCIATTNVTINPIPATIGGASSVCIGAITTLTDATSGGTWSRSNTNASIGSTTGIVTGLVAGTVTMSYSLGTGCYNTTVITVNPLPVAIAGASAVCLGSTTTLSDASAGGVWTVNNSNATIGAGSGDVTGVTAGTSIATYTLPTGCFVTKVMTINPVPSAISGASAVCVGSTTTLTDATGGGTWTSGSANATVGSITGIVSGITAGTTTISYILGTGCTAIANIVINPLPAAIGGSSSVCVGAITTLTDATSGGVWTVNNSNATIGAGTGIVTGVTAGTSIVTYTLPSGCFVTRVMTINPLPAAISGASAVCVGSSTTLTDATAGGIWSSGNSNATVGSTTGSVTGITAGTSTISYILGTGCYITTDITINPLPAAITGTTSVCVGSVTTLADATGGGTWSSSNANASVGSLSGDVTGNIAGTSTISYTIGTGCTNTTVVTINPLPASISGTTSACIGQSTTLSDASAGGTWSTSNSNATIGSTDGVVIGVTSGTATVTYQLATSCLTTVNITINPLPVAITGTLTVCPGTTTTLSDATSGGSWGSSNSNVTVGSSSGIVTGVTAGGVTITYTLATGCYAITDVLVNPLPATITGTASVCVGLTTTLSDATSGGVWTVSNSNATIGAGTGVVTGVTAGTTIATYTLATGCYITKVITVNPLPLSITGASSVNEGLTTTLSDATSGGTWSSGSANATIGSTSGIVTGITAGTSGITYTLPTGCIATTIITINASPSSITGTLTVCEGANTTLSSSTSGGTWSSSNSNATVGSTTGIVTGNTAGTTIISYILSGGGYATAVVTVNPLPAAISGSSSVCVGATTTLTDITNGGSWSSSNSNATISSASGSVSGISAGTATISYTLSTGCYVTTVITINPLPVAITGSTSVCVASVTTLSDATSGGLWSVSNANATIGSSTGDVTGITAGSSIATYTLGTGCYTTTAITINSLPAAITGTSSVCEGLTTTLHDATVGGSWSISTSNATIGSLTGVVTGITAGTATASYTLTTGCQSTAIVTINPLPSAISGASTVCIGANTTLTNASTGGTWSSTVRASVGSATGIVTGLTAGSATISYVLPTGCLTTTVIMVNPTPASITGTRVVCEGANITLADASAGGTWSTANSEISVGSTTGIVTGITASTATVSYVLGTGCYSSAIVTVNPVPAAITGTTTVCVGQTTTLSDITSSGTWVSSSSAATVGITTGIVTGVTAGSATLSYILSTGCYVTTPVTINPLPSAITGTRVVCEGANTTLTDATVGGNWTSSNSNIIIGSSTGIVTGVTAGSSIVTYTLGTGCITTSVVTVNPVPVAISGTTQACVGATSTLSDATSGGTWSSSNSNATIGITSGIVTGISSGTATMTYRLGTGCVATTVFTINPLPFAITGSTGVCTGFTTSLNNAAGGGLWSISNANATIGSADGVVTGVTPGTARVTYTLPTGCYVTTVVTINSSPAAITGNDWACTASTITLSNSSVGGYWSSSNGNLTINSTSGVVTGVTTGTAIVTYTLGSGCIVTKLMNITNPPAAISGASSVCASFTTTLTDATSGGTWSVYNTNASIDSLTGVLTGLTAGIDVVTYTASTGCYSTTYFTVNPLPYGITGSSTVCVNSNTTLSDISSAGLWSANNGNVAIGSTNGIVTGLSAGSSVISYTLGTGCYTTTTIGINPVPAPVTGASQVCAGSSVTFSDVTTGGSWSSNHAYAPIGSATGIVTGIAFCNAIISYVLPTGCVSTASLTVNSLPASITGTGTVCEGSTVTYTDATSGGSWVSSNSNATVGSTTGIITGVAVGNSVITYALTTGCIATKTITVNLTPATISGSPILCIGSPVTFTDATPSGIWSRSNTHISIGSLSGVVSGISLGSSIITYTLTNGCFNTYAVDIDPTAPITGAAGLCVGSTTTLSNSITGGTWSSGSPSIADVDLTTGVVTGISAGPVVITYTFPSGCLSTMALVISTLPSAITGSSPICAGTTTTFTNTTSGGSWYSSDDAVATIDSASGLVTGIGGGTATITYSTGVGCYGTAGITINPITPITGPINLCLGATTTYSNGIGGGTWTSTDTSVAIVGATSGVVTGQALGTTYITYTLPSGCYRTVTLTVSSGVPSITGAGSVCVGQTITLTNTLGGGTWTSSAPTIAAIGIGSGIVTGIAAGYGTVNITYTIGTGCRATSTISVNALAPINAPVPAKVCLGQTITFTDAASGGTWISSNPSIASISASTGIITGNSAGTSIITYMMPTGCYSTATVISDTISAISGATDVCVGQTITLTDATSGGVWTSSAPTIATIGLSTGVVTGIASGYGAATITYSISSGCKTTMTVSVNALTAISVPGTGSVCVGNTITFTDAAPGGTWTSSDPAVATINPSTGLTTGISGGTSLISYTLPSGCSASTVVTVNSLSGISGPSAVCVGNTITLSDATPGGTWYSSAPTIAAVSPTTGTVTGVASGYGSATITYFIGSGCLSTITVSVNPLANITVTGSPVVCIGQSITMTDVVPGGSWTSGSTGVATVGSTGIVTGVGAGTAQITYTLPTGCMAQTPVIVNILSPITGSGAVCVGQSTTLSDATTGGSWSTSAPTIATVGLLTGVVTGIASGYGNATITYTLGSGCSATYVVTVNSLAPISVTGAPNVCVTQTISLSDASAGGTWSSASPGIATVGSTGIVTGQSSGTATISYILPTGCFATTNINVFSLSPIGNPGAVCVGQTITLTDPIAGGVWSSSSPSIATIGSSSGILTGIASVFNVTITYSMGTGCRATTTVSVVSSSAISGPTTVCQGSNITLTSTTAGGTWSSSAAGVASVGTSGVVTGVSGGTAVITYTLGTGCTSVYTVTVNAVAPITGPTSVCQGQTITLSNAIAGGTWTSNYVTIATVGAATGIVTGVAAVLTIPTISYTLSNGCRSTYAVTVNALSPITGSTTVCQGQAVTMADATAGGTWSTSDAVITLGSTTGLVNGITPGPAAITYILPNGCTTQYSVTVNALAPIMGAAPVCVGQSVTFTNAIPGGVWTSARPSALVVGSSSGIVTGMAGGYYPRITYTMGSGCFTTVMGTVNALPAVAAISGAASVAISGAPITLFETTIGGFWSTNDPTVATVGSTTGVVTGVSLGVDVITYSVTSALGCVGFATKSITVGPTPLPDGISYNGTLSVCVGSYNAISVAYPGGVFSMGTSGNGIAIVNPETGIVTGLAAGRAMVTYTVYNGSIESLVLTNIIVNELPDKVNIAANPGTTISAGQEVTFTASIANGGTLPAYQWLVNGLPVTGANSSTFTTSSLLDNDVVACTVGSASGCSDYTISGRVVMHMSTDDIKTITSGSAIAIRPNPNAGQFNLVGFTGSVNDQEIAVEVTDMIGQVVYKDNLSVKNGRINQQLTLASTLANGMYILNLHTTSGDKIIHFVIER